MPDTGDDHMSNPMAERIHPPGGAELGIATGFTDMRSGMNSLALKVQEVSKRDPHAGDLFVFRGKRGNC